MLLVGCAVGAGNDGVAPWSVPAHESSDDGDVDVDPHDSEASSTGEVETGGGMMPPPPDESSTSASFDSTGSVVSMTSASGSSESGRSEHGSESSDDGEAPPTGDPLWSSCNGDDDCDSDMCFAAIDPKSGDALSAYCTDLCEDASSDCAAPDSGNATLACVGSDQGNSLCGLSCRDGETCPDGMLCLTLSEEEWFCF